MRSSALNLVVCFVVSRVEYPLRLITERLTVGARHLMQYTAGWLIWQPSTVLQTQIKAFSTALSRRCLRTIGSTVLYNPPRHASEHVSNFAKS